MKQKIEKAKRLHGMAKQTLDMLAETLDELGEDYQAIVRRKEPSVLPGNNAEGRKREMTDAEVGKKRREIVRKSRKKSVAKLDNGYLKRLIIQAAKGSIRIEDITPEMIEAKREQIKLKRGVHEEQKITQAKLDASWE